MTTPGEELHRWRLDASASGFYFEIGDATLAHHVRAMFRRYLLAHGGPQEGVDIAELIFGELLGNVTRHAPGPVEVRLRWTPQAILHLTDSGPGYEVGAPVLPPDWSESNRGLFLIEALGGEHLHTFRDNRGRNVTAVHLPVTRELNARR